MTTEEKKLISDFLLSEEGVEALRNSFSKCYDIIVKNNIKYGGEKFSNSENVIKIDKVFPVWIEGIKLEVRILVDFNEKSYF